VTADLCPCGRSDGHDEAFAILRTLLKTEFCPKIVLT